MIELKYFEAPGLDVYQNQAFEKYILDHISRDETVLYLWRNDRTVVIGRNQDAYGECDTEVLEREGGHLARRISGGGAVYHDRGNLNFSFISSKDLFDMTRQNAIILQALRKLGINARCSGRNDLEIEGRKFSGHASYKTKEGCLHHGTLMLEVDEKALARYLKVPLAKLHARNVASVRSRVINLKSILPDLQLADLQRAVIEAAEENYETAAKPYLFHDPAELFRLEERFKDPLWRYGRKETFSHEKERRFRFGMVKVCYDLEDDKISRMCVYTDALDTKALDCIEEKLAGKRLKELDPQGENEETAAVICLMRGDSDEL